MADLKFLVPSGEARERVVKSRSNVNPNGQSIKAGGMILVHCIPACDEEFRSGSHPSVIVKQLDAAGWQVTESVGSAAKGTIYRCPQHKIIERTRMSGQEIDPRQKRKGASERKLAGRSSHDGGEGAP